jgi:large subunit ribosomal protein L16
MLFPKKVKHRKWQTNRMHDDKRLRPTTKGIAVSFGQFGLKAMSQKRVKSNQIESARKAMSRHLGKTGKYWIRIFPDRPFTKKPSEVKMGKGKGDPQGYEIDVFPGRILLEVDGVTPEIAKEALRKAGTKLPVKTKVVARD